MKWFTKNNTFETTIKNIVDKQLLLEQQNKELVDKLALIEQQNKVLNKKISTNCDIVVIGYNFVNGMPHIVNKKLVKKIFGYGRENLGIFIVKNFESNYVHIFFDSLKYFINDFTSFDFTILTNCTFIENNLNYVVMAGTRGGIKLSEGVFLSPYGLKKLMEQLNKSNIKITFYGNEKYKSPTVKEYINKELEKYNF